MRNFAIAFIIALTATLGLAACHKGDQTDQTAQAAQVTKPTNPNDMKAWKTYLVQIVMANMQGINNRPYMYYVPAGDDQNAQDERGRVQDTVNGVIATTVLPGNMIAAGGPDSSKTADVLVTAFKAAQPGSFKGVTVLFVGDAADKDRVQAAVVPSGATFRFAQI